MYDSTEDTQKHITLVRKFLNQVMDNLQVRAIHHDESKLVDPEKSVFDEFTPKLKETTYGCDE